MEQKRVYKGVGISNGKVSGKIKIWKKESIFNKKEEKTTTHSRNTELKRLDAARSKALCQIKELEKKAE